MKNLFIACVAVVGLMGCAYNRNCPDRSDNIAYINGKKCKMIHLERLPSGGNFYSLDCDSLK